jgi:hypothetical protein
MKGNPPMTKIERIRREALRKKSFIAERAIDLVSKDPLMLELAENDPMFRDMFTSLLVNLRPELRLWVADVVIGGE